MSMMAENRNSRLIFIFESERPWFGSFLSGKKGFFFDININLGNRNQSSALVISLTQNKALSDHTFALFVA